MRSLRDSAARASPTSPAAREPRCAGGAARQLQAWKSLGDEYPQDVLIFSTWGGGTLGGDGSCARRDGPNVDLQNTRMAERCAAAHNRASTIDATRWHLVATSQFSHRRSRDQLRYMSSLDRNIGARQHNGSEAACGNQAASPTLDVFS